MSKRDKLDYIYHGMKYRCYNSKAPEYKHYGERGITVCDEWKNDRIAFKKWALSHGYKEGLTIDRIDNNLGYSVDNCRWVDRVTQMNNMSTNRYINYHGKTQTMAEWCRELKLNYAKVRYRMNSGWSAERAFEVENGRVGCKHYEKLITYKGKTQSIKAWCEELNLNYSTVKSRFTKLNYSVEKAFSVKKVANNG